MVAPDLILQVLLLTTGQEVKYIWSLNAVMYVLQRVECRCFVVCSFLWSELFV